MSKIASRGPKSVPTPPVEAAKISNIVLPLEEHAFF